MKFNDIDLTQYFIVEDIRRDFLSPSVVRIKIPGRAGSVYKKSDLTETKIDIDVRLIKADKSELNQTVLTLAGLLFVDEPKKLKLSDYPDLYCNAILQSSDGWEKLARTGRTTLTFLCPEPFLLGGLKTHSIPNTFLVTGTYKSKPVITTELTAAASQIQVTNMATGEFVKIVHPFTIGDVVTIDCENEFVSKNGFLIMEDVSLDSDFFDIEIGSVDIASTVPATLTYVERWLI